MKLRHLLFGVLAGVAFVACTNDNEPTGVTPVKGDNEVATASYMKINFVMPGNATTRAADQGFEFGTDAENAVNSGVLFFFDGTTQVADPFDLSKLNWNAQESGTIEKKSDIVVVLENPLKNPTSVVAVLNATMSELGVTKSSTLDDIKAVVKDFATNKVTSGKFVMSSSAYKGAENNVAAKVTQVFDTRAKAEAAASTKIPVERVVAKVQVNEKQGGATVNLANTETASNKVKIDGAEKTLSIEIKGWYLDNLASTSLLLKDISKNIAADEDATNMRSYWAKPVPGTLKHGTFKDAVAGDKYAQENTKEVADSTQVVVGATLKLDGEAAKLVKYLGKLYTETGFATEAINVLAHKYYTKNGNDYTAVGANDIEVTYGTVPEGVTGVTLKSYEAYANVAKKNADAVFYVKSGDTYKEATAAEVTADLKGYVVQRWNNGMTYYFVPIKHDANRYGVIRNHVYKLTINSINGLGTPVPFNDTDTIIPEIPEEKETYISAEIDILAWKIVEQGVDLGK